MVYDGEDQVTRRERFEAAHPDITIEFRAPLWHAWVDGGVITRIHLRWLLDALGAPVEATDDQTPTDIRTVAHEGWGDLPRKRGGLARVTPDRAGTNTG